MSFSTENVKSLKNGILANHTLTFEHDRQASASHAKTPFCSLTEKKSKTYLYAMMEAINSQYKQIHVEVYLNTSVSGAFVLPVKKFHTKVWDTYLDRKPLTHHLDRSRRKQMMMIVATPLHYSERIEWNHLRPSAKD